MSDQNKQTLSLFERARAANLINEDSEMLIISGMDDTIAATAASAEEVMVGSEDPISILLVLDGSYSMWEDRDKVKVGLRNLIKMGKKLYDKHGTETILGVVVFDRHDNIRGIIPFTLIDEIDPDWIDRYDPRGDSTALLDATFIGLVGSAGFGFNLREDGIRGGKRIMVVLTDGGENGSKKMLGKHNDIAALMADLRRPKQNIFSLIGLGPDHWFRPVGQQMGFKGHNIVSIDKGPGSLAHAFELISQSMELHSTAMSTGQTVEDEDDDGDILIPQNVVTDEDAEDELFS